MQTVYVEPHTCVDTNSSTLDGITQVSDLLISESSDCRV